MTFEVTILTPRTCKDCGQPMHPVVSILCTGGDRIVRTQDYVCTDPTCQEQRDMAALRHAYARGECGA